MLIWFRRRTYLGMCTVEHSDRPEVHQSLESTFLDWNTCECDLYLNYVSNFEMHWADPGVPEKRRQ